jgi:hypothetical protein
MTDDDKALVEWLRDEASFAYERAEKEMLDGAADRIEAQAAEIEELKSWKSAEDAHHHKLRAEIERLREAGKDLGFYAGHDDSCDCVKGWAKGPCNCGYTETWKQWSAALGETK